MLLNEKKGEGGVCQSKSNLKSNVVMNKNSKIKKRIMIQKKNDEKEDVISI